MCTNRVHFLLLLKCTWNHALPAIHYLSPSPRPAKHQQYSFHFDELYSKMHGDTGREQAYCNIIAPTLNHSSSHDIETNTVGSGAINRLQDMSLLAIVCCILMGLEASSSCASLSAHCVLRISKKKGKNKKSVGLICC